MCWRVSKRVGGVSPLQPVVLSGWGEVQLFDRGLKVGLINYVDAPRVHDKHAKEEMAMERGRRQRLHFVWGRAGFLMMSR